MEGSGRSQGGRDQNSSVKYVPCHGPFPLLLVLPGRRLPEYGSVGHLTPVVDEDVNKRHWNSFNASESSGARE